MNMNRMNLVFLENLEWFDDSGTQLVQRIPQEGSGEIKYGAQLTVRENQAAVFYYKGKALEAFGPGRHTLKTGNIPILTKIVSLPWGLSRKLLSWPAEDWSMNPTPLRHWPKRWGPC
mgnify:CR=1 FL=1